MALIINGTRVTEEQIYEEMDNLKAASPNPPNCCEQDEEYRGYARDNLIARTLLIEQAGRLSVAVEDAEVDEALAKIKEEAGGEEHFYINYNTSADDEPKFKLSLSNNLLVQKVLDEVCGPKQEPTDEEIEAFYQEHIQQYMKPEEVRVSHLLKSLDHGADAREVYKELRGLRQRIIDGEDFAKLADEHSDKPGEGGDLGFFPRGELVEEFEAVVFSMNVDELSPIFLSPFGYHIAKVTGRKEPEPYPLDEIRDQVREHCRDQRHHEKMRAYVEQLKAKATIEEVEEDYSSGHEHVASADDEA